jgi:hypothetical protein
MASASSLFIGAPVVARRAPRVAPRTACTTRAAAFTKVITQTELTAKGGRAVVEVGGQVRDARQRGGGVATTCMCMPRVCALLKEAAACRVRLTAASV